MSVVNGRALLELAPIVGMLDHKAKAHGVSYGLTEAGYDIRIKQEVTFRSCGDRVRVRSFGRRPNLLPGRFTLASAIEEFQMPECLVGIVHDKSTWARRGLSVFNTVIEPGWNGFLTLELIYHGNTELVIPAGAGIAQVLFHRIEEPAQYVGKYQDQPDAPVAARES